MKLIVSVFLFAVIELALGGGGSGGPNVSICKQVQDITGTDNTTYISTACFVDNPKLNFDAATQYCMDNGMYLFTPDTVNEATKICLFGAVTPHSNWINGRFLVDSWVTLNPAIPLAPGIVINGGTGECLDAYDTNTILMRDCAEAIDFFCEYDKTTIV